MTITKALKYRFYTVTSRIGEAKKELIKSGFQELDDCYDFPENLVLFIDVAQKNFYTTDWRGKQVAVSIVQTNWKEYVRSIPYNSEEFKEIITLKWNPLRKTRKNI